MPVPALRLRSALLSPSAGTANLLARDYVIVGWSVVWILSSYIASGFEKMSPDVGTR